MELDFPPSPEGVRVGRALFLGPSGSGKTTLAIAFIRSLGWPKRHIRVVAPPTKTKLAEGLGVPNVGLDINDREAQEAYFSRLFEEGTKPYNEGGMDIGLALDDADFYFSAAGRTYGSNGLASIVKLGREAGFSQVFVGQGSSSISKDVISNSTAVFIARTVEPNLLDYARKYMRDIPDVERIIANLPPHVFMVYAPNMSPKLRGFAKYNPTTGQIECREPTTEEEEQPEEESPPTEPDEEATSPDESASSPDAPEPSPTDTAPDTVTNTSPPIPPSSPDSG
ncbi:MAG: ATP-binding protein [Thermoplasmata archaeon]|nr:ATP-binding protein [Thermoplasmata archaeon]